VARTAPVVIPAFFLLCLVFSVGGGRVLVEALGLLQENTGQRKYLHLAAILAGTAAGGSGRPTVDDHAVSF
jgi:hypothetical protein